MGLAALSWGQSLVHHPCVPGQAMSSSLCTLTAQPSFIFPAKSPEGTWPGISLSKAAVPKQSLQISGLSEKASSGVLGPRGSPLAGWQFTPSTSSSLPPLSQAGRRQQILSRSSASGRPPAATGNLSYAKRLQIAASQPCLGTAGPDRAPLPAGPPLESWHRPDWWKKSPCGLCNCSLPWPWLPRRPQPPRENSREWKGLQRVTLSKVENHIKVLLEVLPGPSPGKAMSGLKGSRGCHIGRPLFQGTDP